MRTFTDALIVLIFIAFFCAVLVDFLAGCGESYTDSQGVIHANECIIFNPK